jgi:hypothetical protein
MFGPIKHWHATKLNPFSPAETLLDIDFAGSDDSSTDTDTDTDDSDSLSNGEGDRRKLTTSKPKQMSAFSQRMPVEASIPCLWVPVS